MPKSISFKPGNVVLVGDEECEIVSPTGLSKVLVKSLLTGQQIVVSVGDCSVFSGKENAQEKPTPLEYLSQEDRDAALERFRMIKPLVEQYHSRKEVVEYAEKIGVHFTTLYRILRDYRATNSIASLAPKHCNRGGKGKARLSGDVEAIVDKFLKEKLEDKTIDLSKLQTSNLLREVEKVCRIAKVKSPVWVTFNRRVQEALKPVKPKGRKGRKARAEKQSAAGAFPDGRWPLDAVQIDHTPIDIILVDQTHRLPIGRAWVTLAIDVYSRMVVGFAVMLDHPSVFSVGQTIAQCILPKDGYVTRMGVESPWDIFGVMKTIYADNAGEFRSEDFIAFEEEYHVEFSWRPVARPEYGGHIERLAGTLNKAIHTLPGSTFSNVDERDGYDSEGNACFTISGIEKWLAHQILDIYHNTKHSALGMTPREKYERGILGDDITPGIGLPDLVEDHDRLKVFLLPQFERSIQREGVAIDRIFYFHDGLRHWVKAKDEHGKVRKFIFRRDPRDISRIFFYNPDIKEHLPIPYRDLSKPPMTIWDLRNAKKALNDKGVPAPNDEQIFRAHEAQKKLRDDEVAKTKQARRQRETERHRRKKYQEDGVSTGKKATPAVTGAASAVDSSPRASQRVDDIFADVTPFEGIKIVKSK